MFNGLHVTFYRCKSIFFLLVTHMRMLISFSQESAKRSGKVDVNPFQVRLLLCCSENGRRGTSLHAHSLVQSVPLTLMPFTCVDSYHFSFLKSHIHLSLGLELRCPVVWMLYLLCAYVEVLRQHVLCNPVNLA